VGILYISVAWLDRKQLFSSLHLGIKHTSKVLQQFNLSQSALCQDLLAEDIGDLLDGDAFAC
jgi:hypothetical protein